MDESEETLKTSPKKSESTASAEPQESEAQLSAKPESGKPKPSPAAPEQSAPETSEVTGTPATPETPPAEPEPKPEEKPTEEEAPSTPELEPKPEEKPTEEEAPSTPEPELQPAPEEKSIEEVPPSTSGSEEKEEEPKETQPSEEETEVMEEKESEPEVEPAPETPEPEQAPEHEPKTPAPEPVTESKSEPAEPEQPEPVHEEGSSNTDTESVITLEPSTVSEPEVKEEAKTKEFLELDKETQERMQELEAEERAAQEAEEEAADVGIFAVKTSIGHEKMVANWLAMRARKRKLGVYAILSPPKLRGYLLLESVKNYEALQDLIKGVQHARSVVEGNTDLGEIEHFLTPKPLVSGIEEGDVVEIIAGPFKGEKAKVTQIDEAKEEITVELFEAMVSIPVTIRGDHVRILEKEAK